MIGEARDALYLDLESEADLARLADADLYLAQNEDRLVILDEVHRFTNICQSLRSLVDKGRRKGLKSGRFLLGGSASIDLLAQSDESLTGRLCYLEMRPIDPFEVDPDALEDVWIRGGFPDRLLAPGDRQSRRWRRGVIRTYLDRDVAMFGPRIAAETLRRFRTMFAHYQSSLLNASEFARSLGVDFKTVAMYLDLLVDLLSVRHLESWRGNDAKCLVSSPRVHVLDSGLVHTLLGLESRDDVLGHPVAVAIWERFAIESLTATAPEGTAASFQESTIGAEIDLVLTRSAGKVWAIEFERSLAFKVDRRIFHADEDLSVSRMIVVYPDSEVFPIGHGIEIMPVADAGQASFARAG